MVGTNATNIIHTIKNRYYEWRYWSNVYRTMQQKVSNMGISESEELIPYINKPGIAFSFDDSFRVYDWYKYGRKLFGYYDIKVTFNINGIHLFQNKRELNQREVDMLLDLQSDGHEIAHHGYRHKKAVRYSNENGLNEWIEDELVSLFNWLEKQSHSITKERFKRPVTYAFPFFNYNDTVIKEIVPKYFKIVRGHIKNDNLVPFNHIGFAPSICIDSHLLSSPKSIRKILKAAKQYRRNLILTCHSILPDEVRWEEFGLKFGAEARKWRTSPQILQGIIYEARKLDLEFYTTSEIAGVVSFIDQNFERCVRKLLSNPTDKWISIAEVSKIKELNIRNQNISNLDGIQYFLGLETIDISGNNIADLRLLEKLPNLKNVYKHVNSINVKRTNNKVVSL